MNFVLALGSILLIFILTILAVAINLVLKQRQEATKAAGSQVASALVPNDRSAVSGKAGDHQTFVNVSTKSAAFIDIPPLPLSYSNNQFIPKSYDMLKAKSASVSSA